MKIYRNFTDVCETVKIRWELQKNKLNNSKIAKNVKIRGLNSVKFPNLVRISFCSEWIIQSSPYRQVWACDRTPKSGIQCIRCWPATTALIEAAGAGRYGLVKALLRSELKNELNHLHTLRGSFSAVSTPILQVLLANTKCSVESSWRDLQH